MELNVSSVFGILRRPWRQIDGNAYQHMKKVERQRGIKSAQIHTAAVCNRLARGICRGAHLGGPSFIPAAVEHIPVGGLPYLRYVT